MDSKVRNSQVLVSYDLTCLWPGFLTKKMHRENSLRYRCPFEPPAGNLEAANLNDGHPVQGIRHQLHDIADTEVHGSLLIQNIRA
jgi:hypothetical protein